ncbi:hypothetical protein PV325_012852 [Microctonus aethiopoides]|nr:hypothetical protein PV325_012852 [Microctonus aethiopoides]
MPIITINDYTWRQTPEEIIITVPIKGNPTKIDIFAFDNYIKASYPPFILELFLFENIVEEESQCTLGESSVVFTLKKAEMDRKWPTLVLDSLTKEKKQEYRRQAIERAQLLEEKKAKERREKQRELQRLAVRKQIELDNATINKIESIRDNHRQEAMADFENWRLHSEKPIFTDAQTITQPNRKGYRAPLEWFPNESTNDSNRETKLITESLDSVGTIKNLIPQNKNKIESENMNINCLNESEDTKNSFTDDKSCRNCTSNFEESSTLQQERSVIIHEMNIEKMNEMIQSKKEYDNRRGKEIIDKILTGKYRTSNRNIFEDTNTSTPMPRQCGTINVKFSERVFPTPARESHHLEEQEWLEKQAEARRKCGFASEDLRPEEQDPQWLKDKGDEFFKAGNYIAAISAYTHGIKLSDKMTSLYANRSAAQYALGNYRRCAQDCSTALQLMIPKCEGNRESRARCHARLGAALCKLSAPQHGIPELETALKLAPDNDTIKRDLDEAKNYFSFKD